MLVDFFKRWTDRPRHSLEESPSAWRPTPIKVGDQTLYEQPLIVFDLETSGLDLQHDTVVALGAVRIADQAIPLGRHLEHVLSVDTPLKPDSQLLHGYSQTDLHNGTAPQVALRELLNYGEGCIWLAFHAEFDRHMLDRALRQHLGIKFQHPLFDVAALAPMLFPEHARPDGGLDHWAQVFGLGTIARHAAAADALLTAEIMLILMEAAHAQGFHTWRQLSEAVQRWRRSRDSIDGPMF